MHSSSHKINFWPAQESNLIIITNSLKIFNFKRNKNRKYIRNQIMNINTNINKRLNIYIYIYIHYPFCWFTLASFFFPTNDSLSRNVIPHYPIKCFVNSMSTWAATFSSGSTGLNSQQSSTTPRDYNKLNRPKKFTLK